MTTEDGMICKPLQAEATIGFDAQIATERTLSLFGLFARDCREDVEGVRLLTNFELDRSDEDSNIEDCAAIGSPT